MIRQTEKGVLIEVRVKPNSKSFALLRKGNRLVLEVTSPPKEGKANVEIVRELKRMLGKDVEIVKGFKYREKLILLRGLKIDEVQELIKV